MKRQRVPRLDLSRTVVDVPPDQALAVELLRFLAPATKLQDIADVFAKHGYRFRVSLEPKELKRPRGKR